MRAINRLPALPSPPAISANRCWSAPLSSTAPNTPNTIAEAIRNTPLSSPAEKPIVATNNPTVTNDSTMPAASASMPNRCAATAAPRTSGSNGSTHGDSVEKTPARNPNRMLPPVMAQALVFSINALIASSAVMPVARPVSTLPCIATIVLCIVTPKAFTTSFWLS